MMKFVINLAILLAPAALLASPNDRVNEIMCIVAEHAEDLDHIEQYLEVIRLINKNNANIETAEETIAQAKSARAVRQSEWSELQNLYALAKKDCELFDDMLKKVSNIIQGRAEIKRLQLDVSAKKKELAQIKALWY